MKHLFSLPHRSPRIALAIIALLSISSTALARTGGANGGGANSVDGDLYDFAENKGVVVLKQKELDAIVKPVVDHLNRKIHKTPNDFDWRFWSGTEEIKWYLDPNPLKQTGNCLNRTVQDVKQVVIACQTNLAVRINRAFWDANPQLRMGIVSHELLVRYRSASQYFSVNDMTDEGIREANRALLNFNISQYELVQTLERTGLGAFTSKEEHRASEQRIDAYMKGCRAKLARGERSEKCDPWESPFRRH